MDEKAKVSGKASNNNKKYKKYFIFIMIITTYYDLSVTVVIAII